MKNIVTVVIGLVILFTSYTLDAQDRWSLEFRSGVSFSTQDLGDADLGTGFGFEGTLAYRFMPHLSAYAGWGWNQFNADQSFAGTDVDFEETGYTFGLQFNHPLGVSDLNYLIRIGGISNHIETENESGKIIDDSGHGLGWQIGAGLQIPVSDQLSLTPTIAYRSLSRDIKINASNTAVDLNYISIAVGLSWSF